MSASERHAASEGKGGAKNTVCFSQKECFHTAVFQTSQPELGTAPLTQLPGGLELQVNTLPHPESIQR